MHVLAFVPSVQMENVKPSEMAIDRPSSKFLGFLKKHYNLHSFVKQVSKTVIVIAQFLAKVVLIILLSVFPI